MGVKSELMLKKSELCYISFFFSQVSHLFLLSLQQIFITLHKKI